jgi:hypothetical protein
MSRRIPNFVLWILLAFSVAAVPVACIPEDEDVSDAGSRDSGLTPPVMMTGS